MAKCNYVSLYGQVIQTPQLKMNQNNQIIQGKIVLKIIRRFSETSKTQSVSTPIILTQNPAVAEQMTKLRKNDMCMLKGVITTMNVTRSWICDKCGYKNQPLGMYTFITPLFIEKVESLSSLYESSIDKDSLIQMEAIKRLQSHNEISNVVHIIGTVCAVQPLYNNEERSSFNFQIASNRKYRLVDGDPEIKTDYPWVRLFGNDAREAANVLDINSTVFIDGSLYTKLVEKKDICQGCGNEHKIKELVSEIRPYSVEYLHNCNIPENEYIEYIKNNESIGNR